MGGSVDGVATFSPNFEMLQMLERSAARLKDKRETSGAQTQEFLRHARSGGMFTMRTKGRKSLRYKQRTDSKAIPN